VSRQPPPPPPGDFSISVSATTLALRQGTADGQTIDVTYLQGFTGTVSLTFSDLPAGVTISPSGPIQVTGTVGQGVSVQVASTAQVGTSTITVMGTGGGLSHTTTFSLQVQPTPSFQLQFSPSSLTLTPNSTVTTQLMLVPGANFGTDSVSIQFGDVHLAGGITVASNPAALSAATPHGTIQFQTTFAQANGMSVPFTITGADGPFTSQATMTLNLVNGLPTNPAPSRTTFQRTDMDPTGVAYDPVRKLVYAAVDSLNELVVYSSVDAHKVATIPIPEPNQPALTADGTQLIVGTRNSAFFVVDPVTLQVVKRVNLPLNSPVITASVPIPLRLATLSSGKVLFLIDDRDTTATQLAEWDPATNSFTNPDPTVSTGDVLLSGSYDHTHVLVLVNGGARLYDAVVDKMGPLQSLTNLAAGALNSDGSRIALLSSPVAGVQQVTLLDGQFKTIATYGLNMLALATEVLFSRDGSKVYVFAGTDEGSTTVVLSGTDLSLLGATPAAGGSGVDYPPDIDETGMVFQATPGNRGVTFLDVSSPVALGVDETYNGFLTPPQGAVTAPEPVTVTAGQGQTAQEPAATTKVFFGAAPGSPNATPGTNESGGNGTPLTVTPPSAAAAGAVNVTLATPDGWVELLPDGFTYGVQPLLATPNGGPASGGTSVTVYGYGLAFSQGQVQVTVGGNSATVTEVFAGPGISPFPFPMDTLKFTTPSGTAGAADIVITTPAGNTTMSKGFLYVADPQTFPSGQLAELAYDQSRRKIYASDTTANSVDVFDLNAMHFTGSIPVGNSPEGLAMTPDSAQLVVTNSGDQTASVINLSTGTVGATISFTNAPGLPSQCGSVQPYAVATTSNHKALFAISCSYVEGGVFVPLDLTTNTFGCGGSKGCATLVPQFDSPTLFATSSADGSKVYVAEGAIGVWDVTTDTYTSRPIGTAGQTAINADGTVLAKDFAIFGLDLYETSVVQDVDYLSTGVQNPNYVFGEKLHPAGGLLYAPLNNALNPFLLNNAVDVLDARRGRLVRRIVLPVQPALTLDAMAVDETGTRLFLITKSGLTLLTLPELPLSVGTILPSQGPAAGGTAVLIRGSGFQSGATVVFASQAANTTFVDGNTLKVTVPGLPPGPVQVKVTNPDGTSYTVDAVL
jgi:DNA-binding beta-propeller fold protein YncE